MTDLTPWWQKTTIYQIYPRSYMDSNGDGIGDLQGIISKLDYIQDLGFETIWLSPVFSSPQEDWGYDVSDYLDIAPEYGQRADVEQLIDQVHQRGMRIIFDLVLNHTSEQHPWFIESRSSKDNPKRDWYIWKDGRGSRPPNNWKSIVGGSGWHFDTRSNQWYYASFLPFQPDLNYRNPDVARTMHETAKYWLDLGIDGFRLDIFHSLFKDALFRDNPRSFKLFSRNFRAGYFQYWHYNFNRPETIQYAQGLRKLADSYTPPKLLLGEIYADDITIKKYLGRQMNGLNLVFLWNLLTVSPKADDLRSVLQHYEKNFPEPYTPVLVFGNHDHQRLMTRIGGNSRAASLLALFQFTSRGVPVTYYGEEIGMSDLKHPRKKAKDPVGRRFKWIPDFIIAALDLYASRDGCRTPMQWEPVENAGFSFQDTRPWLPVNENYQLVNVSTELEQEESLLNTYRSLLRIRRDNKALHQGSLDLMESDRRFPQLLVYKREFEENTLLVLINFDDQSCRFENETVCQQTLFQIGSVEHSGAVDIVVGPLSGIILSS